MTKASPKARKPPITRAPRGDMPMRRVLVSLTPEEHDELKRLSFAEGRSASSLARIYLLRGMRAERRHTVLEDDPMNPASATEEPKP